ncbi:MAG TPA: hypothetical protein ENJ23_05200 [Bacteroidetes bacterium]|nr:hypothetical protein [Bacteroidota bacterium]
MSDNATLYTDALKHQDILKSTRWRFVLPGLTLIGVLALIFAALGDQPQRIWQVFLVNLVYFIGIAQAMVVFAAALQITTARWGRPLKRFAELGAVFAPASVLLLAVLYFGRNFVFPWIQHPVPEKARWLNVPFLFSRDFAMLIILGALSLLFLKISVRADRERLQRGDASSTTLLKKLEGRLATLAPIIGILYAVFYSLLAFDLIMSLDPHWYSTLFGAYYFITSFFSGLAMLVFISAFSRTKFGLEDYIGPKHFHDIGKLLFGFAVVSGDFFYSQFLVIWYGNLPEETRYVILRLRESPWSALSYTVLFVAFVIPFVIMLSRKAKQKPGTMMIIAGFVLVGVWLEKFLLVAPSIWHEHSLPIGIPEILLTVGFFALFAWLYMLGMKSVPLLPVGDPLLHESLGDSGH